MIVHNLYAEEFGCRLQSLEFVNVNGIRHTVGVALPGKYESTTKERETIQVTSGVVVINGQELDSADGPKVVEARQPIVIEARFPSSYICWYGDVNP